MSDYYYTDLPEQKKGKYTKIKKDIFEWLDVAVVSIIFVILLLTLMFRVVNISGESMENTFFGNEKIIISNIFYKPDYGDVVVISRNIDNSSEEVAKQPLIKRVIATEGQTVDIDFDKGIVYVDGKALVENYTKTPTNLKYDIEFPVTVPEGCVFVMGDNRNKSIDSRSSTIGTNGMIDERYILGKAIYRIWPFSRAGSLE